MSDLKSKVNKKRFSYLSVSQDTKRKKNLTIEDILDENNFLENLNDLDELFKSSKFKNEDLIKSINLLIPLLSKFPEKLPKISSSVKKIDWKVKLFQENSVDLIEVYFKYLYELINLKSTGDELKLIFSEMIVPLFFGNKEINSDEITQTKEEKILFSRLHKFLNEIMTVFKSSHYILINQIYRQFPYYQFVSSSHSYICFFINSLMTYLYIDKKLNLIKLLIEQIWLLDLQSNGKSNELNNVKTKETAVFDMEITNVSEFNLIDSSIDQLFNFIDYLFASDKIAKTFINSNDVENDDNDNNDAVEKVKKNEKKSLFKQFFFDLLKTFKEIILPVNENTYCQFILIYLGSLDDQLNEEIQDYLWELIEKNHNETSTVSTVYYLTDYLVHSKFITDEQIINMLENYISWLNEYIDENNFKYNQFDSKSIEEDLKIAYEKHKLFYAISQSTFYLIIAKHENFDSEILRKLRLTNIQKIIASNLNPLAVCLPVIVDRFACVARDNQIAFCSAFIERNRRSSLPTLFSEQLTSTEKDKFFPFHKFSLKKCENKFKSIYHENLTENLFSDVRREFSRRKSRHDNDEDDALTDYGSGSSKALLLRMMSEASATEDDDHSFKNNVSYYDNVLKAFI